MKEPWNYNAEKLQELIVYIARRSAGDHRFGSTKLNKILFYSDHQAYRRFGRPITGAKYQHLKLGPCPQQFLPAMATLRDSSSIREVEESTYGGPQRRIVALREADLSLFTGVEIAVVNDVIEELRPLTNTQVSDESHETVAWRLTSVKQEIPYGTALLSSEIPTDEDLAWLQEVSSGERMAGSAK